MYREHKRNRIMLSVLLDCGNHMPPVKRRKVSRAILEHPTDNGDTKRQSKSGQKLARVQEIVKQLKDKHGSKYTTEKLNCWAHMVDMDKHDSLDQPPSLPFFGAKPSAVKKQGTESSTNKGSPPPLPSDAVIDISPGKLVKMRGDSISQINAWHELLEKGAITREQYSHLQKRILSDINNDFRSSV